MLSPMILALWIMRAGGIIAHFMKKVWWLRVHRSLGISGAIFFNFAILAIVVQITLAEREHFRIIHS